MRTQLSATLAFVIVLHTAAAGGAPLGTAFTYQGQLQQNGSSISGTCDLQVTLFDAETAGNLAASTLLVSPVTITDGLFTAQLDFGNSIFNGQDRWLEIGVRCPVGTGTFTTLSPRQKLTAAPYALFSAGIADNSVTSAKIADGSIAAADVGFPYAASSSPGGPAGDVSFNYAGSSSKGGAATDVDCAGCVSTTDVQDSGITAAKISPAGSTNGQVLTSNGSGVVWKTAPVLPFAGSIGIAGDAFAVTNPTEGGNGIAGRAGAFGTLFGSGVYGENLGLGVGVTGVGTGFGVGVRGINTVDGGVAGDFQGRLKVSVNSGDIATFQSPSATNRARIDSTGKGFFNGGTQSSGADVAEFITASTPLTPGDVVEIDPQRPGHFRLAATANSTAVADVVSTEPGVSLNAKDGAITTVTGPQLALVGRVPVKVSAENGPIQPGELLVASSVPGHAMRASANPAPGTVIGKAMGSLSAGTGVTEMLVMLR